MAPYSLSSVVQVYGSPEIPNWFEKMLLTPFNTHTSDAVQSKAFSLAATLKGCKGVFFTVFLNQFGI